MRRTICWANQLHFCRRGLIKLAGLALAVVVIGGGLAVGGAVLLTSGPLAQRNQEASETEEPIETAVPAVTETPAATETAEPRESLTPDPTGGPTPGPTGTPAEEGPGQTPDTEGSVRSLAEIIDEGVDTSTWARHESVEAGVAVRVPPGFEVVEREWGPFLDSDDPPPTELVVRKILNAEPTPPEGEHGREEPGPGEGIVVVYAVLFHPSTAGSPEDVGATRIDSAEIDVLGDAIVLGKFVYERGEVHLTASADVSTERGNLVLSGQVGGDAEVDIRHLIGILTSLEVVR